MSSIKVSTSDSQVIDVPLEVVKQIVILNELVQLNGIAEDPIPLQKVDAPTMSKVIEYCMHHKDDPEDEEDDDFPKRSDDIDEWDLQFMQVDQEMLFSILLASNFLEIKPLMDLGCKTVANMIRNKDAKQIRQMFNIADDPSEEENKKIEEANEWSEAH